MNNLTDRNSTEIDKIRNNSRIHGSVYVTLMDIMQQTYWDHKKGKGNLTLVNF